MVQNVMTSLGETADKKINELADASRQKINELTDASRQKFEDLKRKNVEDLYRDTSGWVRSNPGKTLIGALATGFVLGMILRKR
jgi:ElaB/YqjD/DUF883 family membrane-anchored ribosome-binding protein